MCHPVHTGSTHLRFCLSAAFFTFHLGDIDVDEVVEEDDDEEGKIGKLDLKSLLNSFCLARKRETSTAVMLLSVSRSPAPPSPAPPSFDLMPLPLPFTCEPVEAGG